MSKELKLYAIENQVETEGPLSKGDVANQISDSIQNIKGGVQLQQGRIQSANYVEGVQGWKLTPTSAELNVPVTVASLDIPDTTTANSFHVESDGDTFWGATPASFTSNNDNAPAYVLKTGVAKFQSVTLSGTVAISGIANSTATDISILDLTHGIVFSVTDADTIAWAAGTVTLSNGRTFSISSGNTGNMAARTYIYIDTAVSSTVLQTTTTVSTAMGANKKLIAVAQNAAGQATFQVYDGIGGLKLNSSQVNISNNNWTYSGTWSVTDADTIAWGAGTLKVSDGTSYSIGASNTGNMAAKTYIYFDVAVSSTAFQTTTTATTAIGDGKVLVAVAQNGTGEANYLVMNDKQSNIDAAQIVAGSITANEIAVGAITATKISVSQLSAIAADMGAITAGTIVVPSAGFVRSGQTAFNTGTGWYIGNDSGTPKFSVGNATTNKSIYWDGTSFVASNIDVIRTMTAGEDIVSGRPVGIGLDGKVARAFRTWASDATNQPSNDSDHLIDVIALTTNLYVALFQYTPATRAYPAVAFTVDNDSHSITYGTALNITTVGNSSNAGICKVSASKFAVAWVDDATKDAQLTICSVSGVTITNQTETELGAGTYSTGECCYIADDRIAFIYYNAGAADCFHGIVTVSTYTPTVASSSTTAITNITGSTALIRMKKIGTDLVEMTAKDARVVAATTTSNTWTVGTAAAASNFTVTNTYDSNIVSASSGTFWVRGLAGVSYCTVSGTTTTVVANLAISNDSTGNLIEQGGLIYEVHTSSVAANNGIYLLTVSGSVITRSLVMSFTPGSHCAGSSDGSKFVIVGLNSEYHVYGMTNNFVGFAYEAGDQDVSMRVQYQGVVTLSGLTIGVPYYVTANSAAGTLTVVSTAVEAGIALSATELLIKSY